MFKWKIILAHFCTFVYKQKKKCGTSPLRTLVFIQTYASCKTAFYRRNSGNCGRARKGVTRIDSKALRDWHYNAIQNLERSAILTVHTFLQKKIIFFVCHIRSLFTYLLAYFSLLYHHNTHRSCWFWQKFYNTYITKLLQETRRAWEPSFLLKKLCYICVIKFVPEPATSMCVSFNLKVRVGGHHIFKLLVEVKGSKQ